MKEVGLLTRLTTRYDPVEDRLALDGQLAENTCRLWLTARLLRQLLPRLFAWLDDQAGETAAMIAMHRWAQSRALAEKRPAAPVVRSSDQQGQAWLIDAVTLQTTSLHLTLRWKVGDSEVAALRLDARALRQWLEILRHQAEQAGWSDMPWPVWLTQPERSGTLQ